MNRVSHPVLALVLALLSATGLNSISHAQTATPPPDALPVTPAKPKPKPLVLPPPRTTDDQDEAADSAAKPAAKPTDATKTGKPKPTATATPSAAAVAKLSTPKPATTKPAAVAASAAGQASAIPKLSLPDVPTLPPGQLPPGPFNRTTILLDAAHGGTDTGSRISDSILEKDVTLALAFKLRSLLSARGFNVVMTRSADVATAPNSPNTLTLDDRAGLANHTHPVACLLLHATAAGQGVHLYSSELDPLPAEPFGTPWLTAQAAWVTQSQRLQKSLGAAFQRASISLVASRASVRPLDSFACPALVVELAPSGGDNSTLLDGTYQQHVAEAIANALVFWQNQAQPPIRLAPPSPTPASTGASTDNSTASPIGAQP